MEQNNKASAIELEITDLSASEMDGKYLTFFTGNQLFGVPIADVVQIVGIQTITEVPEYPSYAKGIINLRGSIIPVIDVRLRLGKLEKEYDERTCTIVTSIKDNAIGFIVDAVDAVTDIKTENISPPPKISDDYTSTYLTGIAKHNDTVVLLMDTSRMLSDNVVALLATQQ